MTTTRDLPARTAGAVLTVPDVASLPSNAVQGDVRWVVSANTIYGYTGSAWVAEVGSVTGPGSSTTNGVAIFAGTDGSTMESTTVTLNPTTGVMAGASIDGGANTLTNIPLGSVTGTLAVANGGTGTTTSTGTGDVVLSTSPTLTTPSLGTPSSLVLTNATGLPLNTGVTNTLSVSHGGTGATTANLGLNNLLPSQVGNGGKFLTTNGTDSSWGSAQASSTELTGLSNLSTNGLVTRTGSGTYTTRSITAGSTKIAISNGDGVSANPSVDVTEANLTISNMGGTLAIGHGGTGQTTKAAAFDALSPLSTAGALIYGGTGGTGTALPAGSAAQVLHGGTTPSWSAVSLTADVTGTLPIANGGTGQTGASAAFNALAPTSLKGDLIVNNGTSNTSQPIGSNNRVLVADSTQGNGLRWGLVDLTLSVSNTLPVANGGTGTTTSTGSGSVVLSASPTLTTPNLGTPSAVVLTSATGLPLTTGVTGILPIANGGTGQNSTATFPTSGTVATLEASQTFTGAFTITSTTAPKISTFSGGTGTQAVTALDFQAARNTSGSPSALASGDLLLTLRAFGYDGSTNTQQARIAAAATQTWTTSNKGTQLLFFTTPNNSTSLTSIGTADQDGSWTLGPSSGTVTHTLNGHVVPGTDNTLDLGSSTLRWHELHVGPTSVIFHNDTTNTNKIALNGTATGNRTLTLPDATDTLVGKATTDALTNKDISSSTNTYRSITQSASGVDASSGQRLGTNTNDSASAGNIGEVIRNQRSSTISVASAGTGVIFSVDSGNTSVNDGNETGITLTAGDWDIMGVVYLVPTSPSAFTDVGAWIGTAKGNSSTNRIVYENYGYAQTSGTFANNHDVVVVTPTYRVSLASNTTYYLKCQPQYGSMSSMTAQGTLFARRRR